MEQFVTIDAIRDAAARLRGVVQHTPLEPSRVVSARAGARTLLKCEHLQRTGSFKLRGAYNRIALMSEDERARGVVCASAGNHAQGVALSARLLGAPATVFMPAGAPLPKVEATRAYGASVVLTGDGFEEALAAARAWRAERGATLVHPFDHADVIAGQGSLGLELLDDVPDIGTVVVAVGGGGLVAGVATAVKALRPSCRVIGVQATGSAAVAASLAAGESRTIASLDTIADGIAVKTPGILTLAHIREYVDEVVTVTDEQIARAVLLLVERAKQVVEPAGAAALAAVVDGGLELREPVVVLLSGGNVDPLLLVRIMQSGLYEEGRYVQVRTRLQDRPGALCRLLALVAETGANVGAVEHHRLGASLDLLQVELQLELETLGPEHISQVLDVLADADYPIG